MARTYQSKGDQDIRIGGNLWALIQCFQMQFYDDKNVLDECFYEVTPEQAEAMKLAADGGAQGKQVLIDLLAALNDPSCATERSQLCAIVKTSNVIV